jgi:hypothetical protein
MQQQTKNILRAVAGERRVPSLRTTCATPSDTNKFLHRVQLHYPDPLGWYVLNWFNFAEEAQKRADPADLSFAGLRKALADNPEHTAIKLVKPIFEYELLPPGGLIEPLSDSVPGLAPLMASVGLTEEDRGCVSIVRAPDVFSATWWGRICRERSRGKLGERAILMDFKRLKERVVQAADHPILTLIYRLLTECDEVAKKQGDGFGDAFTRYGLMYTTNKLVIQYPRALDTVFDEKEKDKIISYLEKNPHGKVDKVGHMALDVMGPSVEHNEVLQTYSLMSYDTFEEDHLDEMRDLTKTIAVRLSGPGGFYRLLGKLTEGSVVDAFVYLDASKKRKSPNSSMKLKTPSVDVKINAAAVTDNTTTDLVDFQMIKQGHKYYLSVPDNIKRRFGAAIHDEKMYKSAAVYKTDPRVWSKRVKVSFDGVKTTIGINRRPMPKNERPYRVVRGVWYFHPQTLFEVVIPVIDKLYKTLDHSWDSALWSHYKLITCWLKDPHVNPPGHNYTPWYFDFDHTINNEGCPVQLGDTDFYGRAAYLYETALRAGAPSLCFTDHKESPGGNRQRKLCDYDKFIMWYVNNQEIPIIEARDGTPIKLNDMEIAKYIARRYLFWCRPWALYALRKTFHKYDIAGRYYTLSKQIPELQDTEDQMQYLLRRVEQLPGIGSAITGYSAN